jgi:hypothetical protein
LFIIQQQATAWYYEQVYDSYSTAYHSNIRISTKQHHGIQQADSIHHYLSTKPNKQQHGIIMDKVIGLNNSSNKHHYHVIIINKNKQPTGYSNKTCVFMGSLRV